MATVTIARENARPIEEVALRRIPLATLVAAVIGTVIAIRFLWVFPASYLPRALSRRVRERAPWPGWQAPFAIAYTGMRGAVSLAAALSIPQVVEGGGEFPFRDLIIFLTFATIVFTVCVEGLTLPALLRGLGLGADEQELREEDKARLLAAEGCNVVLAARREDRLNSLAARLGEGALAVPTDVTDAAACAALVA